MVNLIQIQTLGVCNVVFPNKNSPWFFDEVWDIILPRVRLEVVICGERTVTGGSASVQNWSKSGAQLGYVTGTRLTHSVWPHRNSTVTLRQHPLQVHWAPLSRRRHVITSKCIRERERITRTQTATN